MLMMPETKVLITSSPEILRNSQPNKEITHQITVHVQICFDLEICGSFAHTTFSIIVLWEHQ